MQQLSQKNYIYLLIKGKYLSRSCLWTAKGIFILVEDFLAVGMNTHAHYKTPLQNQHRANSILLARMSARARTEFTKLLADCYHKSTKWPEAVEWETMSEKRLKKRVKINKKTFKHTRLGRHRQNSRWHHQAGILRKHLHCRCSEPHSATSHDRFASPSPCASCHWTAFHQRHPQLMR